MTFSPNVMQLLTEHTVTGAAATSIRFDSTTGPSIDLDRDRMYVIMFSTHNPTVSNCTYNLLFNNDTTLAHYEDQFIIGDDGGAASAGRSASTSELLFLETGVTGYAFANIIRDIDGNVRFISQENRGALLSIKTIQVSSLYAPPGPANVTRMDITGTIASAIAVGSIARLYRVSPI